MKEQQPMMNDPGRESVPGPNSIDLLQVASLVLWLTCLATGLLGLWLGYPMPAAQKKTPPPVAVQIADVQISNDPLAPAGASDDPAPQADIPAPSEPAAPPDVPSLAALSDAPAMAALAEPSPSIAFATPAPGPGTVVDPKHADSGPRAPAAAVAPSSHAGGAVQHLTFGQGQGRQPAPTYPRDAVVAGEQGVVLVQFEVDADGRVTSARVTDASRWPALNQAALQAVRERWRFSSGSPRTYDVSIRFQLN